MARFRLVVGVAVLVGWCLSQEARSVRRILWVFKDLAHREQIDPFLPNQNRLAVLRNALPRDEAVGYVTDVPRGAPDDDRYMAMFVQAQYALAPHLVLDEDSMHLVVGNFFNMPPDTDRWEARGLRVVHDFGKGVLLLERVRR